MRLKIELLVKLFLCQKLALVASGIIGHVNEKPPDNCETQDCLFKRTVLRLEDRKTLRMRMTGMDLLDAHGYNWEKHDVTSEDGYILTLFRIPFGRNQNASFGSRMPVLLHHGFLEDGFEWVLNSVHKALGYRLPDSGYDVWLINNRGTYYSLGHKTLSFRSRTYWNFSFHEMALYDTPAIIDYVLKVTKKSQVYYIAHSLGCTVFFASMSLNPEYNSKVKAFVALAPAVYIGSFRAPFVVPNMPVALDYREFSESDAIHGPLIPPDLLPVMQLVGFACAPQLISRWICFAAMDMVFGYNFIHDQNYDLRNEIILIGLSSSSVKTLLHLMQIWKLGRFQQYDYFKQNTLYHGQSQPPVYNLSLVTAPVITYCTTGDVITSCRDIQRLAKELSNVKEFRIINDTNFNHIDLIFSTNVNPVLNDEIVERFQKLDQE